MFSAEILPLTENRQPTNNFCS